MFFRKIGALLRGQATSFQLVSASVLGGILGFLPGFSYSPGLTLSLSLLLVVLNANLFLAGIIGLTAHLISLAIAPVIFSLGKVFLDGPFSSLLEILINGPITAWFGFEYYMTTGGLFAGSVFGLATGLLIATGLNRLRKKLAFLENNSDRYEKFVRNLWIRLFGFILLGGIKGKKSWSELSEMKKGNPIRPIGVVLLGLVLIFLSVSLLFLDSLILTIALKDGLERINKATVDIGEVKLELAQNKLIVSGIALTDANDLGKDLFRASLLEADISGFSLLRKKVSIDRLSIVDASHGEQRDFPGQRIGAKPAVKKGWKEFDIEKTLEGKSIDDLMTSAGQWKERLAQVRSWLEKIDKKKGRDDSGVDGESLQERLERRVRDLGYREVRADHRIAGSPTLSIGQLLAIGVKLKDVPDDKFDFEGVNISTQPGLLKEPLELNILSQSGRIGIQIQAAGLSHSGGKNQVKFHYKDLPVNSVKEAVSGKIKFPMSGGFFDLSGEGTLESGQINIPVEVVARNTRVTLPGLGEQSVSELAIPVKVSGMIDNPRIHFAENGLQDALKKAGKSKLQDLFNKKAGDLLNRNSEGGDEDKKADVKGMLDGLFKKPGG